MTKWKCDKASAQCIYPCYAEIECEKCVPKKCLFGDTRTPKWEKVTDEPEQKPESELPDWCKVGAWVWVKAEKSYERITWTKDRTFGTNMLIWNVEAIDKTVFQARIRPWTFYDAPVFLKVEDKGGEYNLAKPMRAPASVEWGYFVYPGIESKGFFIPFDSFAKNFTQLGGAPCGVLEHLEDGEWKA